MELCQTKPHEKNKFRKFHDKSHKFKKISNYKKIG